MARNTKCDLLLPWAGRRRVALGTDGLIKGIHHPNNTNKWVDGMDVDWSAYETNGWNCMVQVPKFYYRTDKTDKWSWMVQASPFVGGSVHPAFVKEGVEKDYYYISAFEGWKDANNKLRSLPNKQPTTSITRTQAETYSESNGTGYKNMDFNVLWAEQLLYLIEYADLNSQSVLSEGITNLASGTVNHSQNTGKVMTNYSGEYFIAAASLENGATLASGTGTNAFAYRGVENPYGNIWRWVSDFDKPDNTKYTLMGIDYPTTPNTVSGYPNNFDVNCPGFVPIGSGGSTSTYLGDYMYASTSNDIAALYGGCWNYGGQAGVFCLYLGSPASDVNRAIGARAAYL